MAVFGAGRMGGLHARNIAAHPQLDVALVCSGSRQSASALADEVGAAWTTDAEDAFIPGRVDAAVIASPNGTHVDLLRRTTAAGLPTLCEKPLDLSADRIAAARDAIRSTAVPVIVGFQRRFDPSVGAIVRRVAEGEIGTVEQVIIISRDVAQHPGEYLVGSGGLFRDMTIHDLDLARCLVDDLVEVKATGTAIVSPVTSEVGDHDSATIVLRGRGGQLVTIVNSRHCPWGYDQRLEVFGADGTLAVGNVLPTTVRRYSAAGTEESDRYVTSGLD